MMLFKILLQVFCILSSVHASVYNDSLCFDSYTIGWPDNIARTQQSSNAETLVVFDNNPSICFGRIIAWKFIPATTNGTVQLLVFQRTQINSTFIITGKFEVDDFQEAGVHHHVELDFDDRIVVGFGDLIGFASSNNDILFEDSGGNMLRVAEGTEDLQIGEDIYLPLTVERSYSFSVEIETIASIGCHEENLVGREMNVNPGLYDHVTDDYFACRDVCTSNENLYAAYRADTNACLCGNESSTAGLVDMDLCTSTLYPADQPRHTMHNIIFNANKLDITVYMYKKDVSEYCENRLGVGDGTIPEEQLTASSIFADNYELYGPKNGRLNAITAAKSWVAKTLDTHQWIQADLGYVKKVSGVLTQGRQSIDQYVKTFKVLYAAYNDTNFLNILDSDGNVEVFIGNSDSTSVATNVFRKAVYAQFIRINPISWLNHISMRFEVLGCTEHCANRLGVEDGTIPDKQLTASTVYDNNYEERGPKNGRLNGLTGYKAWIAKNFDIHQWIQADLGYAMKVTGVLTQGRQSMDQYVKTFKVLYSFDDDNFLNVLNADGNVAVFIGNSDRTSVVTNMFHNAVYARFIRINPITWLSHISMRFEVLGCTGTTDEKLIGNTPYILTASVFDLNQVLSYTLNMGDDRTYMGENSTIEHVFLSPGKRIMEFEANTKYNGNSTIVKYIEIVYDVMDTDIVCTSLIGRFDCIFSYILGSERDIDVTFSDGISTTFQTSDDIITYGSNSLSVKNSSQSYVQTARYIKFNEPIRTDGRLVGFEAYVKVNGTFKLELLRPVVPPGFKFCLSSYSYVLPDVSCDKQPNVWKKNCSKSAPFSFRKRNCGNSTYHIVFTSPPNIKISVIKEFTFTRASVGSTYLKVDEEFDVKNGDLFGYKYTGNGEIGEEISSMSTEFMMFDVENMQNLKAEKLVPSNKSNHILRAVVIKKGQALISHPCDGQAKCYFNLSIAGEADKINIVHYIQSPIYDVQITCVKNASIGEVVNFLIEEHPGMDNATYEWNFKNGDVLTTNSRIITYLWLYGAIYNVSLKAYNDDSQWIVNVLIQIIEEISELHFIEGDASKWNIVENYKFLVDINHAAHVQWSSNGSDISTIVRIGTSENVTLTLPPSSSIYKDSLTVDGVELRNLTASNKGRCRNWLGLQSQSNFADAQFEASTTAVSSFPHFGRLSNIEGAWTPQNSENQWLQINLLSVYVITGIITQGGGTSTDNWVEKFYVTYGRTGDVWYNGDMEQGIEKHFVGNFDATTSVTNIFNEPVYAKYLRVNVVPQVRTPALRMELIGCLDHIGCLDEMGLKSREVSNTQLSSNIQSFNADTVRLGHDGTGWCLSTSDIAPVITVIFPELNIFTGIVFEFVASVDITVSFKFAHSFDNVNWEYVNVKENLEMTSLWIAAYDNSEKWTVFSKEVHTRFIRIEVTIQQSLCLRFELLGCKGSSLCRHKVASVNGRIPVDRFTYSDDGNKFVMIDLLKPYTLTGVVTEEDENGRSMQGFHVEYSLKPSNFKTIRGYDRNLEIFNENVADSTANVDNGDATVSSFRYPVIARFVRLFHTESYNSYNPTFYVLGCKAPQTCQEDIEIDLTRTTTSSGNKTSNDVRLGSVGWRPADSDYEFWVSVALSGRQQISGILTRCTNYSESTVPEFYVAYSLDRISWTKMYTPDGTIKMFTCNNTHNVDDFTYHMFDSIIIAEFINVYLIVENNAVVFNIGILGCKGMNYISFTSAEPADFLLMIDSENLISQSTVTTTVVYTERITGFKLLNQNPIIWDINEILIASKIFSGVISTLELFINGLNYTTNAHIFYSIEEIHIFYIDVTTDTFNELNDLNVTIQLTNALSVVEDYTILSVQYEILDLAVYSAEYVATHDTTLIEFDMLRGSHILCDLYLNDSMEAQFEEHVMKRDEQHKISFSRVFTNPGLYYVSIFCANNVSDMNTTEAIVVQNRITDELEFSCDSVVAVLSHQPYNIIVSYSFIGNSFDVPTDVYANYTITGKLKGDVKNENYGIVYDENLITHHTVVLSAWDTYEFDVELYNEISSGVRQCSVVLEEMITDLNLDVQDYVVVNKLINFNISVTWGSRMEYTIDFNDGTTKQHHTSDLMTSIAHAFNDPYTFYVNLQANNAIGELFQVDRIVTAQHPVKGYEVKSRYLNKLELNAKGEPSHVVVPVDMYLDTSFAEPSDPYFSIDFDDGTVICPPENMCTLNDYKEENPSKNFGTMKHILYMQHNYTRPDCYIIRFTVWNEVSNGIFEYKLWVFEGIEQLENEIQFTDVHLINNQTYDNTTLEDTFEDYIPLGKAVVATATKIAGTEVIYTWNFNDRTQPKINYIVTTHEPVAYYQYTEPGSYLISVNGSNLVSYSVSERTVYLHETVNDINLIGSGPVVMNSSVQFQLDLGRVATDACYRIDFICTVSLPAQVRFYGSKSMCESQYPEEFKHNPTFTSFDSEELWLDVHYENKSSKIDITNKFYEFNKYMIFYEGVNRVSYINNTLPQVITNFPCYFPTVDVESENLCSPNFQCNSQTNYRQYQASITVKVQSIVTVNCTSTKLTLYQWKVFKIGGNRETQLTLPPETVTNGSGLRTLVIEPGFLTYAVHRFELNVTMLGGEIGLYTLDSAKIEIIPTPLIVEIVGGEYRKISWDKQTFTMDALSLTYDPDVTKTDKTGMTFIWMCRRARSKVNGTVDIEDLETFEVWNSDFSVRLNQSKINDAFVYQYPDDKGGCFGKFGGDNVPDPGGILNYTTGNITLNTSSMYWDMEYEIKLIVQKGDRRSEVIQILDIVEGEPPDLEMSCKLNCKIKKTPTNRFSLQSTEKNKRRGVTLFYIWELWKENNGYFEKIDGEILKRNSGTGNNVSNLSIEPGLFEEKQKYRVICTASRNAFFYNNGAAHLTFVINDIPSKGNCTITPESGIASVTDFFISCDGFQDDDVPLSYTYQYSLDNGTNRFTFFNEEYAEMQKGVTLPAGSGSNDSVVNVYIRVTDIYGSFIETKLNVTVFPLNCSDEMILALTDGLDDNIKTLAGAGQTEEVSNIVSSTASLLNYCSKLRTVYNLGWERSNSSTLYKRIREDMITTMNLLQPPYDMGILSLMASALQLCTTYPDELTNHARNLSIYITTKFATMLEKVDSPLAEDIEESARLVFSSLGVPTTVDGQDESSATDGIEVITSILNTMTKTMVTGQQNVYVNTDSMSVTVSRSFTEGQEDVESDYRDQCGNQVTKLPELVDIIGEGNDTTLELETRIIVQSNDPYGHGNDTGTLRGSVISIDMKNDTGQPVYITYLPNPMEFNIYRGEDQFQATPENSTNEIEYQYFETVATGMPPVDVILIDVEMHTAITVEIMSFGEEEMVIGDLYTYTIVVLVKVNDTPTEDDFDTNCTLIQYLTPINISEYDRDLNEHLWNDTAFIREGDTICFFSNVITNMFLSTSLSDVHINVRHARLHSTYSDENKTVIYTVESDDEHEKFNSMRYGISFFASQCYYRSSSDTRWHYDGCEVGINSTRDTTQCFCNSLVSSGDHNDINSNRRKRRSIETEESSENLVTVGGGFSVPMNSIDLGDSAFTKLSENPVVFAFMTCCLCVYVVVIIWARKEDQRDISRAGVTPMCDNDPRHNYKYEITIFTGVRSDSATTAKVSFILLGEKGDTGIRVVRDKKRPILQRSGIDSFLMTVQKPLGTLVHLRIWHDNTGASPKWFLSRVSIKDIQTNRTYYFMLDRWLGLEEDDGQIERVIPTAGHSELTSFGHLFHSRTRRNLTDSHLWVSVFMRPPKSSFTRCQRCTCCLSLLFCTMMANILFYGVDVTKNKTAASFTFGPVSFSTAQMVVGVISSLIVFPINMIIVQLFRLSRPQTKKDRFCAKWKGVKNPNYYPQSTMPIKSSIKDLKSQIDIIELGINNDENSKAISPPASEIVTSRIDVDIPVTPKPTNKRKSSLPFPWWCKYVSWVLTWMTIGVAFWLTIEVAGQFGSEKATEWVTTMTISLTQDIVINQPLKVLLLATFYSLIIKSPDKEDDEITKVQLEEDEELLHEQIKEEDLADPTKLEEFNQQRLADVASALPPDRDEIEDQRDVRLKEIKMHEIIKEITAYVIFLFLLMGVAFGNIGRDVYALRRSMVQTFVEASYNGKMQFTKISSRDYFWNYTNNVFLPSLYAGVSYNGQDDPDSAGEHLVADRTSAMLSKARFRQLRIQEDICVIPPPMDTVINTCRTGYSSGAEESRHFEENWIPIKNQSHIKDTVGLEDVWRYKSWIDLGSLPYWGIYTIYGGGGYVAELGDTLEEAWEIADYLRSTKWVDQRTRAVFYEFTIFNPASNRYGVAYMIAEFLPTGGVVPYYNFQPVLIDRYSSVNSFFVILCEVCFGLFILWFLFKELMLFRKQKLQYFKSASNLLEFIVLFLSLMAFVVFVYRYFIIQKLLSKRKANNREFMNFQFFGQLDLIYYYILGFVLFISTIKFLKLLRFNRKMLLLANTIGSCYKELLNFFFMFVIVFASYASAGYMLFITGLKNYSTIIGTFESLFSTLLGKFDFDAMKQTNRILGPLFFFSFILMIVFILMNVFLTIINEAFARTRAETNQKQNSLEIVDFMFERFKLWTGFSEKRVKKQVKKRYTYIEGVEPIQIECDLMSQKLVMMVDKLNEFIRKEKQDIDGLNIKQNTEGRPIYVV